MNLAIFLARSPKMTASSSKPSTSVTYDLLYYISSEQAFRKPVGKDLREGEITLPLIFTLPEIEESERNRLEVLFKNRRASYKDYDTLIHLVRRKGLSIRFEIRQGHMWVGRLGA